MRQEPATTAGQEQCHRKHQGQNAQKMPPGFVKALQGKTDLDEVDETPRLHHRLGEQAHRILA